MLTILLPQKRMNDDKSNAIAIASRQMFVYDWYLFIVSAAVFFSVFRLQYHNTDCHTFNCYWVNPKTNTKSEPRFNAIGTNHLN